VSFLTAALYGLGAFGQGRQQRTQNQLAQQQQQQQAAYDQAQIAAEQARTRDERTQNQLDPATGQFRPYIPPRPLTQVFPNNHGKAPAQGSPEYAQAHVALLYSQANDAERGGYPVTAANLRAQARDEALNTNTLANAAFTSGAKTANTLADAGLANARAKAAATAQQTALQIAGMNNQGRLAIAGAQIQGRFAVANLNDATRVNVANLDVAGRQAVTNLAGAYHLKGLSDEDAWREALAKYNDAMRVYGKDVQTNPDAPIPQFQEPAPSGQPITINVGGVPQLVPGGNGVVTLPSPLDGKLPATLPPPGKLIAPGVTQPVAGASLATGAPGPSAAPTQANVKRFTDLALNQLHLGRSLSEVQHGIAKLVQRGTISQALANRVLQALKTQWGQGF
jgi:hypothetical protein